MRRPRDYERIASLTESTGTEPLTVDFNEESTPRLADYVAFMANSHGGLIFVGITDTDREIVGVRMETMWMPRDRASRSGRTGQTDVHAVHSARSAERSCRAGMLSAMTS